MRGYGAASYGDGMADVYDSWYQDLPDGGACVDALVAWAGPEPVLELGVGTGRLAIPLAERGPEVHGIDASAAMLDRLAAKPGGGAVHATLGDMAGPLPPGPFSLVFVAFNTFFNLTSTDDQRRCLAAVATSLAPGGRFVVEASVPADEAPLGHGVEVRSIDADRVVLVVSQHDPEHHKARSQMIEITAAGVKLRPLFIHYVTPTELDELAGEAGLALEGRWSGWTREPFTDDSERHVSSYTLASPGAGVGLRQ